MSVSSPGLAAEHPQLEIRMERSLGSLKGVNEAWLMCSGTLSSLSGYSQAFLLYVFIYSSFLCSQGAMYEQEEGSRIQSSSQKGSSKSPLSPQNLRILAVACSVSFLLILL